MKKTILTLAMATTLMAGTIFTGCQSSAQKEDAAQADVKDAKQDLNEAQQKADAEKEKSAKAFEWQTFKNESDIKIRDNEVRIAEVREKMKSSGKTLDAVYAKRVDTLEQQNKAMRTKIDNYEKSQSDWETFKREFNHDMDEFGKAFKNLTVDNKK